MDKKTNLINFFGDNPELRIIDALVDNIGSDYSKKEIQELAQISKGALFKHWKKIEEIGIVKITRKFGKTKLYTLNTESQAVKDLLKLEMSLIEETAPKTVKVSRKSG